MQGKSKIEKLSSLEKDVTSRRRLHDFENEIITKGSKDLLMNNSNKNKIDNVRAKFKLKKWVRKNDLVNSCNI